MRPHRRQPTRLPHPWDSPGKNTGVGCHFLLQCMKIKRESEVAQSCPTLSDSMDYSLPGSSVHGIFQARVLEWGAIAFSAGNMLRTTKRIKQGIKSDWCWSGDWGGTWRESRRPVIVKGQDFFKYQLLGAAFGLHYCTWTFSSCGTWSSHFAGFSCCRARPSRALGFRSCGMWA